MKITRENYEVFLIDFIDGNLEEESKQDLDIFLTANPDIKEEMNGLQDYCLTQQKVEFPHKEDLLYTEYGVNETDRLLVGELERDLTPEDVVRLAELKKNKPELERDAKLFSLTKLKTDLSVHFGQKENLKRKQLTMSLWTYAAAASIIMAIASGVMFWDRDTQSAALAQNQTAPTLEVLEAQFEEVTELSATMAVGSFTTKNLLPKCFAAPVRGQLIRTRYPNVFEDVNSYLDSSRKSLSYRVMGK